ncbi:Phenylalanyl-tRNA synthetase alpha chain [Sesbania bispinosa]|nr:Phenylalanyl-tRNA synthetase alpha chain [Sesbania bispinosa]
MAAAVKTENAAGSGGHGWDARERRYDWFAAEEGRSLAVTDGWRAAVVGKTAAADGKVEHGGERHCSGDNGN